MSMVVWGNSVGFLRSGQVWAGACCIQHANVSDSCVLDARNQYYYYCCYCYCYCYYYYYHYHYYYYICNMGVVKGKHTMYYVEKIMRIIAKRKQHMAKHMRFI